MVIFHTVCTGYGIGLPSSTGPLSSVLAVVRRLWVGVPLFFVISGYCITASADAARWRPDSGAEFFCRRFRRIYPPFWTWLLSTALGVWFVERFFSGFFERIYIPNPASFTRWQWVGNLSLTETWRWHLSGSVENVLLHPSWTLCYEEQFYVIVGLALIFARRWFFGFLAVLSLFAIVGLFAFPMLGWSTLGLCLDGKWLMFAAGVLVYYTLNYGSVRKVQASCLVLAVGVLCSVAAPEHLLEQKVNEPNLSYLCAFAFALLLIAIQRWDAKITGWSKLRPLMFYGEISYSLYLIHWPVVTIVGWGFRQLAFQNPWVIFFVGVTCCVAVASSVAYFFHRFVERKFRNSVTRCQIMKNLRLYRSPILTQNA